MQNLQIEPVQLTIGGTVLAPRLATVMLYENLAAQIREQIRLGVLPAGERLRSVRQLARDQGVSVSTAVLSYQLLEQQGLIEARPQSGFYVRPKQPSRPSSTRLPRPACRPMVVSKGELITEVLDSLNNPELVQLGTATPAPELLPAVALNRLCAKILKEDPDSLFRYEKRYGNLELRTQIARLMWTAQVRAAPDDVVICNGGQEAVMLALRAVAEAGDVIAVESPCYYGALQAIQSLGMKALEIPSHPQEGLSLEALKLALDQWPIRAVFAMPTVSNPLGSVMPEEKKRALHALLCEHDLPLIENDAHAELAAGVQRPLAIKSLDNEGRVLLCSSFSKTLAPGGRVGWLLPGRYQERVTWLKYVNNLSSNGLLQKAIAAFLAQGGYERHVRKLRQTYARMQTDLVESVAHHFPAGTKTSQPGGGMVIWVELPSKVSGFDLYRRALDAGISIVPGRLFSAQNKYEHFVRLSCGGAWDTRIERAVAAIGQMARELAAER